MSLICIFSSLCIFIGLISLTQFISAIYLCFIQTDLVLINNLLKTDRYDSYLFYILFIFIGLGFISLISSLLSMKIVVQRMKSFFLFILLVWIFIMTINCIVLLVSLVYYFFILPNLDSILIRSFQQSPLRILEFLDPLQSKYQCCGITNHTNYEHLLLDPFPTSCCRLPNCWRDNEYLNDHEEKLRLPLLMHPNGCYSIIERFLMVELWIFIGITACCVLFQLFAIIFLMLISCHNKKFDHSSKIVVHHSRNEKLPQGSIQTIEENVEITQI